MERSNFVESYDAMLGERNEQNSEDRSCATQCAESRHAGGCVLGDQRSAQAGIGSPRQQRQWQRKRRRGQQTNGCGGNGNNGNSGGNCFARGTLIRTREGYRPIETLAVGDEVAVRFGGFAPIKAMVSHTLNSVSGKWVDESNLPVLVRRGALGENSPNADLCLTALHAVFVDGFLMKSATW